MHPGLVRLCRVGLVFDVPANAFEHLRGIVRRPVAGRGDLDGGLVLPRIVDDVEAVLSGLVEREARLGFALPATQDRVGPMPAVVAIAFLELQVFDIADARLAFPFLGALPPLVGLIDDLVVGFGVGRGGALRV